MTTLISMLLGPYKSIYDALYVFSPSVEIDSAWDPVREFAKGIKQHGLFSDWDEKALMQILEEQRGKVKELKQGKSRKPLPQTLVIIDDFADRHDIMHISGNTLTSLFIRGRHFGVSTWLSSQKLSAISSSPCQLPVHARVASAKLQGDRVPHGGTERDLS